MSQLIEDRVQRGRDAYRRHAWHEAFDLLRQADSETPASPSGSEDFSTFTNVISGCFVFVNGGDADDAWPDMNHHPRFNIVESSFAAGIKTEVQIVLDVLVMVSPETADRKGGHPD
jgi:metal-dependent amidase/aminoacylase/carboxypeptidase family protein